MSKKNIKDIEKDIVKEYLTHQKSATNIAKQFKISQTSVLNYLKKNNVEIRSKAGTKSLNLDIDQITNLYNDGLSAYEIQDIVKCKSVNSIYNIIRKYCTVRNGRHNTNWNSRINKDFFKEPLSENAQYWLGFIYADGSIYKHSNSNTYVLSLEVAQKDSWLIHKFKEDLCLDNKVQLIPPDSKKTGGARIQFSCQEIINDLIKLGIHPQKTWKSDAFFSNLKNLTGHILRGFFDGDGWNTKIEDDTLIIVGFVGNWYSMDSLRNILSEKLNLLSYPKIDCNPSKNRWPKIKYARFADVLKIYSFMYDNDPKLYLSRKKDKFFEVFKTREEHNLSIPLPSL